MNREKNYLQAMFNELTRLEIWKGENPLEKVRALKVAERELSYLTLEQIDILIAELRKADNEHVLLISQICLATGARWSEAENPKNVVYISEASFAKLEPAQKKKLMDAAYAAEQRGWKMSQDIDLEYENQLVANKMLVNTLDPGIRLNLDRTGENLVREWLKKAGGEELMVLLKYTSDRSMGKK